jgi:hypothetical protein
MTWMKPFALFRARNGALTGIHTDSELPLGIDSNVRLSASNTEARMRFSKNY